jgi:Gram-negative bacterial TonB protein C-terminal
MRLILSFLFLIMAIQLFAQTPDTVGVIREHVEPCSDAYLDGKEEYLKNYLQTHGYPDSSDNSSVKVYVEFYIDSLGNIERPKIKRGYNIKFDKVAIDIVRNMPRWTPMICYGVPKRVRIVLPITFRLQ